MGEAVNYAKRMEGFKPCQFENPKNVEAHFLTTAPEIDMGVKSHVDIIVSGVGSGGTIMGVGKYFRKKNPKLRIIAVMPKGVKHGIEGIGAGFKPPLYEEAMVDETVRVSDEEAVEFARRLGRKYGIACGISSGAAYFAALRLKEREENSNKNIVAILPDGADRYFSTSLFD
jgi:cysteine synthase A